MDVANGNGQGFDREAFIAGVADIRQEVVLLPEWGATCQIVMRTCSALDYAAFTDAIQEARGDDGSRSVGNMRGLAVLIIKSATKVDGAPFFEASDVEALLKKSRRTFERLVAAATRVNAVGETDQIAKK